jgi:hypothetical protein
MEPLSLSTSQRFEIEKMGRAIDQVSDIAELRGLCKQLLQAWMSQKAATAWVMRQQLSAPPTIRIRDD